MTDSTPNNPAAGSQCYPLWCRALRVFPRIEDYAACRVNRAAERASNSRLANRYPEQMSCINDALEFSRQDTERVVNASGTVDTRRSIGLSLASTTAALIASTQPTPYVAIPAVLAVGGGPIALGWAVMSMAWPYVGAALGQGVYAAIEGIRPGGSAEAAKAAGLSAVKNAKIAGATWIPLVSVASTMSALASQLTNRSEVRALAKEQA
ncbi:MAG: hypothetical protein AAFY60_21995, partial [Myxococcota bacterium]